MQVALDKLHKSKCKQGKLVNGAFYNKSHLHVCAGKKRMTYFTVTLYSSLVNCGKVVVYQSTLTGVEPRAFQLPVSMFNHYRFYILYVCFIYLEMMVYFTQM